MNEQASAHTRRTIGFGIEEIGHFALTHRWIFWILIAAVTLGSMSILPRLKFDSDLTRMYEGSGAQYENFIDVRNKFGMFETDLFIFVRSEDLTQPERLEKARLVAEEIALTDHIAAVLSPFTLRLPQPEGGTIAALPLGLDTQEKVAEAYQTLHDTLPLANNLITPDFSQMTFVAMPLLSEEATASDAYEAILESLSFLDLEGIDVEIGGQPVWMKALLAEAGNDQAWLNGLGFLVSAGLALAIFRHPLMACVVIVAPALVAIWAMAATILLFQEITFFTMVLATLMLMLSLAESVYFVRTWQLRKKEGLVGIDAVKATMRIVSPATVLSMLTTAVCFISLSFAPGRGIKEFAIGGAVGTMIGLLALLIVLPLLLLAVDRLLPARLFQPAKPSERLQRFLTTMITRFARPVALLAVVIVVVLMAPYAHIKPVFSIQQLIPEKLLDTQPGVNGGRDTGIGGIAPVYVSVKLDDDPTSISRAELEMITDIGVMMEEEIGAGQVLSLAQFGDFGSPEDTMAMLDYIGPDLANRFVTTDGTESMITGFTDPNATGDELEEALGNLTARIEAAGYETSLPTGFRVLTTYESENLIDQLEFNLITAIILVIFMIGLAFREWHIMTLSMVPNLFPLLAVVGLQYVVGVGQTMTSAIVLTIAFGVAVNDTIHLLNAYRHHRRDKERMPAVTSAITEVGKSMITTTAILCAGVLPTLNSVMPQVVTFGQLFIGAMSFALIGDLLFLPAIIAATRNTKGTLK